MANSKSKGSSRPNKTILGRTLILALVCGVVAFSILAWRLYKLMIVDHDFYEERAVRQQTRTVSVAASRGTITDANGKTLAQSATAYNIFISPYEIDLYSKKEYKPNEIHYGDDPMLIATELNRILGADIDTMLKQMKDTKSWYKTVASKVEPEVADEVRAFIQDKKIAGVHIEVSSKRYYPQGSLACHVIGFVGTENYGLEGIEALYDSKLEGTNGSVVRLVANNGTEMLFENYQNYNDAVDGYDITLTLDSTVQAIAEKYLKQAMEANYILNGGCVIVMNVKTGEILALANANAYDLNDPFTLPQETLDEIAAIEDPEERAAARDAAYFAMYRNMAVSDTYEPGSVFKIITMAIALEEGVVDENDSFYCSGSIPVGGIPGRKTPLSCWKHAGHGSQNLREAAMHSCNVAFVNIGLKIGAERYYDYVRAFGLRDKTGVDLSGESGSIWWTNEVFFDPNNKSQLAAASFGQTLKVTPIQMITAVSAAVNGGYLMEPYIVKEMRNEDGEVIYARESKVVRQVISEETSALVADILESVVSEKGGTGSNAYVPGYRVGGKTGTTTKTEIEITEHRKEYMVSFCGVAPCDDPEVAVLLVLDNPDPSSGLYIGGGGMAAPYVGKIMSELLPYLGVQPVYSPEEEALLDVSVPRLVNSDLTGAREKLTSLGLTFREVGEGTSVVGQLPVTGAQVAAGSQIILYLSDVPENDAVKVPDLTGMKVNQARNALQNLGLFLDTSGASPSISGVVVQSQAVEAGTEVPYGAVINVTLVDKSNQGRY